MTQNEKLRVALYKLALAREEIKGMLSCDACTAEGDCASCLFDVPVTAITGYETDNWTWQHDWIQTVADIEKYEQMNEEEEDV